MNLFDRDQILSLSEELVRRGTRAEIFIVGGAAMALAYDARRSTRDIDAVFEPHGMVLDEARVARRLVRLGAWVPSGPTAADLAGAPGPMMRSHRGGGQMSTERTLVLVKPDGVARGLVGEVIARIERKGLRLLALELRTLDGGTARTHYAEHVDK